MTTGEGASTNDEHRPGDTLRGGRFAITGKLGEGGQGTTFDGIDKRDGRRVTLKRFRVRGASSWKEVELAEREAKVLAHVDHPHLPVYVDHFEEAGSLYLVTEHIEGETVARLREGGPLSEAEVLRFLADASGALDYLHRRAPPLVHRDIKPSNIIRRPDGSFAIIDFGAVRDRLKVTGTTVVGTFGYMAPEQFQGRAMPASDVYAVAATAVAMLTGAEPEDLPHRGLAIDVASALPGARPELVRALTSMLEPDPDRRAPRIGPLLDDLRAPPRAGARASAGPRAEPPPSPFAPPASGGGPYAGEGAGASRPRGAEGGDAGADFQFERELQRGMDEAGEQVKRAAAEIGATFMRVVDEVSRSSGHDLKREARRAAELARRAVKEAKREARRERERERDARKQERDAREQEREREREARRAEAAALRDARARAPLGGPVLLVVLLALTAAQLAVVLALRVVTPVVLYVLSALFFGSIPGRAMRRAGGVVSDAGKRAVAALGRAKDVVRGRAPLAPAPPVADTTMQVRVTHDTEVDPHAPTHISTVGAPPAPRARVEPPTAPPRARIGDDAPADDEVEIDVESAAEEESAPPGKRTRN